MNFRFTAMLAAAIFFGGAAVAGPKDDVLHEYERCASIAENAARLACYNSLAPRMKAAIAPPAVAAVPPEPAPPAPASPAPAPAPHVAATPPPAAAAPSPKEQEDWFGRNIGSIFATAPEQQTTPEKFGADSLPEKKQEEANAGAPKPIDSITAKLDDYAFTPLNKFIVFLDNGQVWRQLDGDDRHAHFRKPAKKNSVKISRGFMGGYDLVLNGQGLLFKVKRVK